MDAFQGMLTTNVVFSEVYRVVKNSTGDIINAASYFQSLYFLLLMTANIVTILVIPELIKNPMVGFRAIYYHLFSLLLRVRYRRLRGYCTLEGYYLWLDGYKELADQYVGDFWEFGTCDIKYRFVKINECFLYLYILDHSVVKPEAKPIWRHDLWIPKSIADKKEFRILMHKGKKNVLYRTTSSKSLLSVPSQASKPFVSHSYKNISQIVERLTNIHFTNSNIMIPAIIINGEPGLGKTFLSEHLRFSKYSTEITIYHINCLTYNNYEDFISCLESKSYPFYILMIDEIDKYFDYLCSKLDKDGHQLHQRIELLTKLMNFVDNNSAIKIFCTNNFNTLFQGNEVHFNALKSRFMSIDMKPYNTEDIVGFYRFINDCLKNTDCYVGEEKLEVILGKIKLDITNGLPRKLNQILVANCFDFEKSVSEINSSY